MNAQISWTVMGLALEKKQIETVSLCWIWLLHVSL